MSLRDLLAFRAAPLEATSVNIDDEEDLDTALQHLREARRAVASRRRQRPPS